MSYQVRLNTSVSVRHALLNLAGAATVSGEAANLTAELRDPTTAVSAVPVTVSEVLTSGFYDLTFTPDVEGFWRLSVTDPASPPASEPTAEGVHDYWIWCSVAGALSDLTARDLTTLARVRQRLDLEAADTGHDDMISNLITEVSNWIQDWLGRTLAEGTYTHYLDGTGAGYLNLPQGPLVSVTSVDDVVYSDGGGGARAETLTSLQPYRFLLSGLRSDGDLGFGKLIRTDGGEFAVGPRRWKVVYVAGFDPLPDGVVKFATDWVLHEYLNRVGLWSPQRNLGDDQVTQFSPAQIQRHKDTLLSPYKVWRFA